MKWMNMGHEFDGLGAGFKELSAIYLFGAGVLGRAAYKKYRGKINIKGFIDNDPEKQGGASGGVKVYAPADVRLASGEAIVITTKSATTGKISAQTGGMGLGGSVWPMHIFFPVFDYYKYGELCLPSLSFLPSTVCNLNCKHCLNFAPYIKEHQARPIEKLKQDLDLLFSKTDTILLLHISGGEPFIYPHAAELINHINSRYMDKLGRLELTTNGTVAPPENLLAAMKNADIHLIVDDYCDSLPPRHRVAQGELLAKLDDYGIEYSLLKASSWIDLAPFETDNSNLGDEQLCQYFNACDVQFQEYRDGKLYLCNYAAYAEIAGMQPVQPDETFGLRELTDGNRCEFMEFRLGYSAKGYTQFCKRCSGFHNNSRPVPVAEQV